MNSEELNELKALANASADSKLLILRSELRRHIPIIQGYSQLIQMRTERGELTLPIDVKEWIDKIAESIAEMNEIIEILTTKR